MHEVSVVLSQLSKIGAASVLKSHEYRFSHDTDGTPEPVYPPWAKPKHLPTASPGRPRLTGACADGLNRCVS